MRPEFGKLAAWRLLPMSSVPVSAAAQPAVNPTISKRAAALGPGQYVWDSKSPTSGPLLLTIDLTAQRLLVYRDGALMAATAISTGSLGRETPTGVFAVLAKEVMHRSTTYDDAPMPYMQRLTEKGIAIHAGDLPGYPASHGCIRLPNEFAKRLYGITAMDPAAWSAAVGLSLISAAAANFIPARRASQVDPSIALRTE